MQPAWAQLPQHPSPGSQGPHPGLGCRPGRRQGGGWRVAETHPLHSVRARGQGPVSRSPPGQKGFRLFPPAALPWPVSPDICYSAQLPGWGGQPASINRTFCCPWSKSLGQVFPFQGFPKRPSESPRSWKPLVCCHQIFKELPGRTDSEPSLIPVQSQSREQARLHPPRVLRARASSFSQTLSQSEAKGPSRT